MKNCIQDKISEFGPGTMTIIKVNGMNHAYKGFILGFNNDRVQIINESNVKLSIPQNMIGDIIKA